MINSVQETALTLASNTDNISFSSDVVRTRSANCVCNGWLNHSDSVEDKVYVYFMNIAKED